MQPAEGMFDTPEMAALFSAEGHLRRLLDFEGALARAEAAAGLIPPTAARAITAACQVGRYDVPALFREAAVAGTPVIPLVRLLSAEVAGDAGRFVHWGATSQDTIDSALMLQMRDGLDLIERDLRALASACAAHAERHRHTPMAGRTLLQQALPITFGLKAARWLALVVRRVRRLRALRAEALVLQFGGAAGTLASLGDQGMRVTELLAAELGLSAPDLPWHTERDRIAQIAAELGIVAGAMAKIAGDLLLLAQSEIGEVSEAALPGKGGSSALPQKRNPVDAVFAVASARLALSEVPLLLGAMAQEHERAAGAWQSEWAALPRLFCATAGAVARVRSAVAELVVHPDQMRANLERGGGLILAEALSTALAPRLGQPEAQRIVQDACARAIEEGITLRQAAGEDATVRAVLPTEALERAFEPSAYLGVSDSLIDAALVQFKDLKRVGGSAT